jgi:hypothetical protein
MVTGLGLGITASGHKFAAAGRPAVIVTASGNAQVDTAQSKFGGASAVFDGSADYLTAETSMGSGDFTLEFFYRPISKPTSFPAMIASVGATFNANGEWAFYDRHDAANTKFRFYWREGGSFLEITSTTSVSNGTWYHLAVSRSGSSIKLFVDGVEEDSATTSLSLDKGQDIIIGAETSSGGNAINGYIDELRISDTARYTSGFTAPTSAFVNDNDTLLLLHMDGTDGSTTFTDDNS